MELARRRRPLACRGGDVLEEIRQFQINRRIGFVPADLVEVGEQCHECADTVPVVTGLGQRMMGLAGVLKRLEAGDRVANPASALTVEVDLGQDIGDASDQIGRLGESGHGGAIHRSEIRVKAMSQAWADEPGVAVEDEPGVDDGSCGRLYGEHLAGTGHGPAGQHGGEGQD